MAQVHIAAITAEMAPIAALHRVDGPLDGTYAGAEAQKGTWAKFTTAQGEQKGTMSDVAEAAPKGATVTADVVFPGKNIVKVRTVMLDPNGMLSDEIWQVDPDGKF